MPSEIQNLFTFFLIYYILIINVENAQVHDFDPTTFTERVSEILEKRPKYYPALLLNSELLIVKKEFKEALLILENIVAEEPRAAIAHYLMGLSYIGIENKCMCQE